MTTSIQDNDSRARLMSSKFAGTAAVIAGGVALYSTNVYLTTSLLPTVVGAIGGERCYAWSMTVFLIASIVSSALVPRILATRGIVGAYLIGFCAFTIGASTCAVSPSMEVLLVGRGIQGLGGGLLAGLGFAVIHSVLPRHLWARGAALTSAMWGVGNLAGPLIGGLFAQFDQWRAAFGVLGAVAITMAALVPRVMPTVARSNDPTPVPVVSLALLAAAGAAISVASIVDLGARTAVAIAVALTLFAAFVIRERNAKVRVLPTATFVGGSSLKWIYGAVAFLATGVGTETFIPLFGQRLGGLSPFLAGLLGAALSGGWALTQIFSSNAKRPSTIRLLRVLGPSVLAVGLAAYGVLQSHDADAATVGLWIAALMVAGSGIGMAFPHLAVAAMETTADHTEGAKAAAGINTVVLIANAFSTASAGVLVNLGGPSVLGSAHCLLFGFAILAVAGTLTALRSIAVTVTI